MDQSEKKQADANKKIDLALDLLTLPLISKFKCLQFNGLADGTPLVPNFSMLGIAGRYFILKAIRIVPEYSGGGNTFVDFYTTDGVSVFREFLPGNTRINRLFDVSSFGTTFDFLLNNSSTDIFPLFAPIVPPFVGGNVPLDLDIDNIFYKYPEKIESIGCSVNARIFGVIDPVLPVESTPNVKVFIQCYLL